MRNRLIELMMAMNTTPELTCPRYNTDETCKGCQYEKDDNCDFDTREADYLIANGVIVPPCKVGDTVWLIKSLNWQQTEWGIKEGKISMIQQKADKSWKFRVTENHSVQDYTVDNICKTVFLTREEAEQALQRKEEGK